MIRPRAKVAWLAGMVSVALAVVALLLWAWREPSYQGRRLGQWLADLDSPTSATNVQTVTALRSMGGEAAVRLVPMLEASDSGLKLKLVALLQKQSLVHVPFTPAAVKHQRAERAFEVMGEKAVAAAPGLVSILTRRGSAPPEYLGDPASRAAQALRHLGPGAIPFLRSSLCSERGRVRYEGTSLLVLCASGNAPGTMTELFKLLDDEAPQVREAGVYALGRVPRQPELVIPRIVRMLADGDAAVRRQAAFAVGRFGSQASNTVAALGKTCSDPEPKVRRAAEQALAEIGHSLPKGASEK